MSSTSATTDRQAHAPARSLVSLLGAQRAAIVTELRRVDDLSVAELADHLGISEVATRRHLGVLEDEGLVASSIVRQSRGRPAARYRLTAAAGQLFPQRYDRFAAEVLDFLTDEHGRAGVRDFLRWRLERQVDDLRSAVTAEDLHRRLDQLADALSAAGFAASVERDGDGFRLVQEHCAIEDVAKEHPEVCAYEAASFSEALGRDVTLSRRQTLAGGATTCVCHIAPRGATQAHASEVRPADAAPSDMDTPLRARTVPTSHTAAGDE